MSCVSFFLFYVTSRPPVPQVVFAVNNFDMHLLAQDYVEVLLRIVPSEEEIKKYKEYDRDKKPLEVLTDEDKFLLQVSSMQARYVGCLIV